MTAYLSLVKFRYHITFLNVIFGALIFAPAIDRSLVASLLLLYASFNVLLYGGIYTFNDLADVESDARHPMKRHRPIASGRVTKKGACWFGTVFIALGAASGAMLFTLPVFLCYIAILIINAGYSLTGRNLRYLDIILNGLPHPVRFVMGALLVSRVPPAGHVIALALLAFALSCLRRHVERDTEGWESRQTLLGYGPRQLATLAFGCVAALAVLCARNAPAAPGFHAIVFGAAMVLVCGGHWIASVRKPLQAVWTR